MQVKQVMPFKKNVTSTQSSQGKVVDTQEPVMLDQHMLEVDMLLWSSNSRPISSCANHWQVRPFKKTSQQESQVKEIDAQESVMLDPHGLPSSHAIQKKSRTKKVKSRTSTTC